MVDVLETKDPLVRAHVCLVWTVSKTQQPRYLWGTQVVCPDPFHELVEKNLVENHLAVD